MALLNPKHPKLNQFVVGASGHIAGVINAPAKNKRSFWSNEKPAKSAAEWMEKSTEQAGSWWPSWAAFLQKHAGKQVKPRAYGNADYPVIESAPGRYVKAKAG
jgi:polyhydroxyalkanoate synthase